MNYINLNDIRFNFFKWMTFVLFSFSFLSCRAFDLNLTPWNNHSSGYNSGLNNITEDSNETSGSGKNSKALLKNWSCEQLIQKSNDNQFSLAVLAGLRAHKKCKQFKYDWRNLSAFDKKIFVDELLEIDPTSERPLIEFSIADLRKKLKFEKNNAEKFKLYKLVRQKYKNNGRTKESAQVIQQLYQWSLKNWKKNKNDSLSKTHYLEASLMQARADWNADKIKSAEKLIQKINTDLKNENLADSYFLSGKINEDLGNNEKALENYALSLKQITQFGIPKGSSLDENKLRWITSWLMYKTEKWTEAEASLSEFSKNTQDLTEKTRADFFRAKVLIKLDKKSESKKTLEQIISSDTYSYYALASYYLLGENLPAFSKIKTEDVFKFDMGLDFLESIHKKIFEDLILHEELDLAEKSIPYFSKNNDQNLNLSLFLAQNGKRYLPVFSSFAKVSNQAKMDVLKKYPSLIFPRPFDSYIQPMSEKTGIPMSLVYSIMKQESGFHLKSRSHADAYGLMQLIPRLAKSLAKKNRIEYKNPDDLFNPAINIPLGIFELKDQVRRQKGQLTFVASAYNAGPGALSGWLKKRKPSEDIFDFIENIPFDETRMYVKIIARNKLFYDRIDQINQSVPFPVEFVTDPVN